MKTTIYTSVLLGALFIVSGTYAQENVKSTAAPAMQPKQTVETKVQNNNTVRSNRTETKATIDQPNSGAQSKAQDHNSSRSNKTGSVVAPNNPDTGGNPDEKPILPNDKTDKSEAARAKKKKD